MKSHKFELFADYFQVYVMDDGSSDDTSEIWTDKALDIKLALAENTIAVGTFRNVDVQFEIEIHESEPVVKLDEWDHASKGYFKVKSGKCAVFGCTDYLPDAARVEMPNGDYSILSLAKGLESITTEWDDADDYYKIVLWPSPKKEYESIKRYSST
ncbi:MAG: hypothetical protein WBA57_24370 [Elainellaceae cyanobacterium]